ncbi:MULTISPECIES: IS701 family transposase [Calothrix]|uniref:Transposase n=2 Tax=Calothrix TaxID=1186 RepID=A0ABR8A9X3_9CYAN|nr:MULTISPECIES: transposase [Calothrix]MBD2196459.1 transposase [Calothrix parietina FACHB-288]MBD2207991.1 transposase [Calothrix sp. FACHB-168]MBD2222544.1 transposase [Calothrix sp. FACHB-1219]MBD2224646.1 transposase [Calothrix anomala FACHB-343]
MRFTKLNYCQYLLSSQINYTMTNLAEHLETISHDAINYYLKREKLTPRLLWDNVKEVVEPDTNGYIIFDDSVLDKRYSEEIEIVRRQYSGNEHGVLKGIGVVSCVYVNPNIQRFWVIDYRIFNPDVDGKTKIDHVKDMLQNLVYHKLLPFDTVLMDTWYAVHSLMLYIDSLEKIYYCPLKNNRLVDDTFAKEKYKRIELLEWSNEELECGKIIKIKGFPQEKKVKLFRVTVSTNRTDFIATNDLSQSSTDVVQEVCKIGAKIEEFHREIKQLTGIESCQCRKARLQRNHIACAMLVWVRLKNLAYKTGQTVYQIKHNLLSNYLIQQLKRPSIPMCLV